MKRETKNADHRKQRGRTAPNRALSFKANVLNWLKIFGLYIMSFGTLSALTYISCHCIMEEGVIQTWYEYFLYVLAGIVSIGFTCVFKNRILK